MDESILPLMAIGIMAIQIGSPLVAAVVERYMARRIGSNIQKMRHADLSAWSSFLLFAKEAVFNKAFGVLAVVDTLIAIAQGLLKNKDGDPLLSINPSGWIVIIVLSLLVGAFFAFHKVRKERDNARNNFGGKSATLRLARELNETYRTTPAREIELLKRTIDAVTPPTPEQVEDVKHKLMSYIKNDTDMVIGTCWEDALGYKDGSKEMARISGLDSSDILGSLNALNDECLRFSARKSDAIENINASAAAMNSSSSN